MGDLFLVKQELEAKKAALKSKGYDYCCRQLDMCTAWAAVGR